VVSRGGVIAVSDSSKCCTIIYTLAFNEPISRVTTGVARTFLLTKSHKLFEIPWVNSGKPEPIPFFQDQVIVDVSAGNSDVYALTDSGQILAPGPNPERIGIDVKNIQRIECGYFHTFVLAK